MLARSLPILAPSNLGATHKINLQSIKKGLSFYWNGTKRLGANFGNAKRLMWLRTTGHKLSWEDEKHLATCRADLLRIVPFSIFIIVPFLEFLLPFFLYYFPSLLPSTYETVNQRKDRLEALQKTQRGFCEKLCQLTPNLKSNIETSKLSKFAFEEPIMDCLSQQHAYLLTRTIHKRAFFGKFTPISILKVVIRRYVRHLYEEDCALHKYGIVNISSADIEEACIMRCITPCRDELEDWVKKSVADSSLQMTSKLLMYAAMKIRNP